MCLRDRAGAGRLRVRAQKAMTTSALRVGRVVLRFALALALILVGSWMTAEPAAAADHSFHLYASTLEGWGLDPENMTDPGPAFAVANGDNVSMTVTSEDGLLHGLFIDYDRDGIPSDGDFISETTDPLTGDVSFVFVADTTGEFAYCDQFVLDHCGVWTTREPPVVTVLSPTAGTSWTSGVAHDIVFTVSDAEGDSPDVKISYTHDGGTVQGIISDWFPVPLGQNTVPWTPSHHAWDTEIIVTARDQSTGEARPVHSPPFEVDGTAPIILSQTPAQGATDVDVGTAISVTWSESMNRVSGDPDKFAVRSDAGNWIEGTVTWSADDTTMTLQPSAPLSPATTYFVHVNGTARDRSDPGNEFASPPEPWPFSTAARDPGRPRIHAVAVDPPVQLPNAPVNVTADVEDDDGIAQVTAHITGPSFDENLTMTLLSGIRWSVTRTFSAVGQYEVDIWAVDTLGNTVSRKTTITIGGPGSSNLPAPASVTTNSMDGVVEVTWSPVSASGVVGYHVYRGDSPNPPFPARLTETPLSATGPTVYRDTTAPAGGTLYYTVTAVDASGAESPFGPASSVTIAPYQNSPLLEPLPWAVAALILALILGAVYGTIWRRRAR